jgi:hypothetical protein
MAVFELRLISELIVRRDLIYRLSFGLRSSLQLERAIIIVSHFIAPSPKLLNRPCITSNESCAFTNVVVDAGHP